MIQAIERDAETGVTLFRFKETVGLTCQVHCRVMST
jgi:hypothetical protein